jgi:hypothetical protein
MIGTPVSSSEFVLTFLESLCLTVRQSISYYVEDHVQLKDSTAIMGAWQRFLPVCEAAENADLLLAFLASGRSEDFRRDKWYLYYQQHIVVWFALVHRFTISRFQHPTNQAPVFDMFRPLFASALDRLDDIGTMCLSERGQKASKQVAVMAAHLHAAVRDIL